MMTRHIDEYIKLDSDSFQTETNEYDIVESRYSLSESNGLTKYPNMSTNEGTLCPCAPHSCLLQ
jgi:hypothetical protein